MVPTTVEIKVARIATLKVVERADIISLDSSICAYHRKENPVKWVRDLHNRKVEKDQCENHQYLTKRVFFLFHSLVLLPALISSLGLSYCHHQEHHNNCHNHRNGTSEIPFSYSNKLIFNHITNKEILTAA